MAGLAPTVNSSGRFRAQWAWDDPGVAALLPLLPSPSDNFGLAATFANSGEHGMSVIIVGVVTLALPFCLTGTPGLMTGTPGLRSCCLCSATQGLPAHAPKGYLFLFRTHFD